MKLEADCKELATLLSDCCRTNCLYIAQPAKHNIKEQNRLTMNDLPIPDESVYSLPPLPGLPLSLQLINTERLLQPSSTPSIPNEDSLHYLHYEDPSIELELPCQENAQPTFASTSHIRKKKTGCTCKKTRCLKMYCECFAAGRQCG